MKEEFSEDSPLPKGLSSKVGWQVALLCLLCSLLLHLSILALLHQVPWSISLGDEVIQVKLIAQGPKPAQPVKLEKPPPKEKVRPLARPGVRKAVGPRARPEAPGGGRLMAHNKALKEELLAPSYEIAPQEARVNPLGVQELQELAPVKELGGPKGPDPAGIPSDLMPDSSGLDSPSLSGQGISSRLTSGLAGGGGLGGGSLEGKGSGAGGGSGGPGNGGWGRGGLGGGGLEDFKGSFDAYLGILKRTGLDVVFVLDSTGSMEWVIEAVKARIANLMGVIKRLVPIARVGLVAYRDRNEEYVTRMHDLTTDITQLKAFLSGVKAEAGGDWEEAVEEGLRVSIEGVRWRKGSKKMVILIGDAPPHKRDLQKALDLAEKFHQQQGGVVTAIDATHESNDQEFSNYDSANIMPEFTAIATHGKGETANLQDKKIIKQLAILTFGSRWEEGMEEYTGDL